MALKSVFWLSACAAIIIQPTFGSWYGFLFTFLVRSIQRNEQAACQRRLEDTRNDVAASNAEILRTARLSAQERVESCLNNHEIAQRTFNESCENDTAQAVSTALAEFTDTAQAALNNCEESCRNSTSEAVDEAVQQANDTITMKLESCLTNSCPSFLTMNVPRCQLCLTLNSNACNVTSDCRLNSDVPPLCIEM